MCHADLRRGDTCVNIKYYYLTVIIIIIIIIYYPRYLRYAGYLHLYS